MMTPNQKHGVLPFFEIVGKLFMKQLASANARLHCIQTILWPLGLSTGDERRCVNDPIERRGEEASGLSQ